MEAEARDAFAGEGRFPLPAYSEYMPSPYVVLKPYAPRRAAGACTIGASDDAAMDVTEHEQAHELTPGLAKIAAHLLTELDRLVRGNAARILADAARRQPRLAARAGRVCAGAPRGR